VGVRSQHRACLAPPPKLRYEPYGSSRATLPRKGEKDADLQQKFLFCFPTLSPKTALMFKPISR